MRSPAGVECGGEETSGGSTRCRRWWKSWSQKCGLKRHSRRAGGQQVRAGGRGGGIGHAKAAEGAASGPEDSNRHSPVKMYK